MTAELFRAFNNENEERHQTIDAGFSKLPEKEQEKWKKRLDIPKKRTRRVVADSDDDDAATEVPTITGQDTRFKYFIDIRDAITLGSLPPATYVSLHYVGPVRSSSSDASGTDGGDDTDSSEDDIPLKRLRPDHQSQVKHAGIAPTSSHELYRDLFVDSQDSNPLGPPTPNGMPDDNLVVRPQAVSRAAPFYQSDEGGSATESSSENASGKSSSQYNARAKIKLQADRWPELGNSILSSKNPKSNTALHRSKSLSEKPKSRAPELVKSKVPSSADTIQGQSRHSNSGKETTQTVRRPSHSKLQMPFTSAAGDGDVARQRISATSGPASSIAPPSKPARVATRPMARRSGLNFKSSDPIRMTNDPHAPKRKTWESDKHFNTLKFRRNAEVRARTEGNPDLNALDFVGSAPANLPKPTAPIDNPYGRREVRTRRVQEDSDEDNVRHRPDPMTDWEASKVPLVCFHWRLSNSCYNTAAKCNFLHRNTDENGRALPIGDEHGESIPKYEAVNFAWCGRLPSDMSLTLYPLPRVYSTEISQTTRDLYLLAGRSKRL